MSGEPQTTLALIEAVIAYRDGLSSRADRDMLADVANHLSHLNYRMTELDYAYGVVSRGFETGVFDFSVLRQRARPITLSPEAVSEKSGDHAK